MPLPIYEDTIKIIWENNPDTPMTSSTLSKSVDYISSYRDFSVVPAINGQGTIFIKDPATPSGEKDRIIMKRETIIGVINREKRIPINKQYKVFDNGLEDLYIRVSDQDDNVSNPQPNGTSWGNLEEWFIWLCDAENELSGQLLVSQSKTSPVNTQVLGNPSYYYTANNSRLIGGFKVDSSGSIIAESVWDIAGKNKTVKAEDYMILDLNTDPHTYRKLRVSDLDSVSGELSIVNGDMLITGNLAVGGDNISLNGTNVIRMKNHANGDGIFIGGGGVTVLGAGESAFTAYNNPTEIATDNETLFLTADNGVNIITNIGTAGGWSARVNAMTITPTGGITTVGTMTIGGNTGITGNISATGTATFGGNTLKIGSAGTLEYNKTVPTGTAALGYNGYFYAARVYNAVWNDLAEFFLSHSPKIIGKVYSIGDNGKIRFSEKYGDKNVVGVCTGSPAFLMKTEYEDKGGVPIALSGTVEVQLCGKIKKGQMLTSDKFGMAKKANIFISIFRRDAIIGKALTDSKKGDKTVMILVR